MDIAYFPNAIAQNGVPVLQAMISALEARGHRLVPNTMSADAALIWSMLWAGRMSSNQQAWEHYRHQQKDVLIMEVGCLRRGELWKIGVNGILPRHRLCCAGLGNRPESLGLKLHPWRHRRGDNIYICLQRTQSWQWQDMPAIDVWLRDTVRLIRQRTDRPIVVRPHPRQRLKFLPLDCQIAMPRRLCDTYDDFDFEQMLDNAWAVVNYNSHSGIQSVLRGVPAFVGDMSLAAPVANLDFNTIESPLMPDRDAWFEDLVWTEFSLAEISDGMPLRQISFT